MKVFSELAEVTQNQSLDLDFQMRLIFGALAVA